MSVTARGCPNPNVQEFSKNTQQGFIQDLNLGGGNEGVSCKFKFCEGVSCKFLSITSFNPQLAWGGKSCFGWGNPRFPPPCMKPCTSTMSDQVRARSKKGATVVVVTQTTRKKTFTNHYQCAHARKQQNLLDYIKNCTLNLCDMHVHNIICDRI